MKLILTGDLHLGRTSTRVPASWRKKVRTLSMWSRLVDETIRAGADALLLSGDILDSTNAYWETIGPLEHGVERLTEAGVQVVAICGNHDALALPRAMSSLREKGLTLLGAGGKWERMTLQSGTTSLHVDGWSFPSETFSEDPLLQYAPPVADGSPVLGMVHGDPGVTDSRYAPLSQDRLRSAPVSGWLLGHIHLSSLQEGPPWILMPGSPHPLDPGETGLHQAWCCEVMEGRLLTPTPFLSAELQYLELVISLTPDDVPGMDLIQNRLLDQLDQNRSAPFTMIRLRVTGVNDQLDVLQKTVDEISTQEISDAWHLEKVILDVHPSLDQEQLLQAGPVPQYLIQALRSAPPDLELRIQEALRRINQNPHFTEKGLSPLQAEDVDLTHYLETLLRQVVSQQTDTEYKS